MFIAGSNSSLLSSEFTTSLGGRVLELHIMPFSFKEFLQWNKFFIPKNSFEMAENRPSIYNFLNQYLKFGGMVETFALTDPQKALYQETLMEKIIINDILKRFNIKYPSVLKNIGQFLETNVGNITSASNLAKWIRNLGEDKKLNYKTVQTYLDYLEKSYLTQKIKKFSYKTKEIFLTQSKYYFIDNLFCQRCDVEDQIENVVFQHLIRNGAKNIYYGRDKQENKVDFVVRKNSDILQALQVCYQLTDANLVREIRSLNLFAKYNPQSSEALTLLCMYDERTKREELTNIQLIKLDEFLLNQQK